MYKIGLKILKEINKHNFEAYIVGGFARNHYLGSDSNDIDIATNAKPFEIQTIFPTLKLPTLKYGAVSLVSSNINFEITTFRKDLSYHDHRHPAEVVYTDSLFDDLLRRDFIMNTLCLDKDGNYVDLLGAISDIDNKIIRTIKDPVKSFEEDVLRILRAIRFATVLYFDITLETKQGILKTKHLLKKISFERKKEELNKIFACPNKKYGLKLIRELELAPELDINIDNLVVIDDPIAMWYQIDGGRNYNFTKRELTIFKQITKAYNQDLDNNYNLYKASLYIGSLVYQLKEKPVDSLMIRYDKLPIYKIADIEISAAKIMELFPQIKPKDLSKVYKDLEFMILNLSVINTEAEIINYLNQTLK